MCNDYRLKVDVDAIRKDFSDIKIRIRFPEGVPNIEPRDDVKITDVAPIVRASEPGAADLIQRRWSWSSPSGKPVYNFRSENREFGSGRCLIVADGFYEFTTPEEPLLETAVEALAHFVPKVADIVGSHDGLEVGGEPGGVRGQGGLGGGGSGVHSPLRRSLAGLRRDRCLLRAAFLGV